VKRIFSIGTVLFLAIILRLLLFDTATLQLDFNTFVAWSNRLIELPLNRFYEGWSDYLPGYLYFLWIIGKLSEFVPLPQALLFKLPSMLADVFTGYLIYKIVLQIKSKKLALISTAFYVFNPAIIANSTLWGQADSLTALFSMLALYLLNINPVLSSMSLAFGVLIKPQVAFVAPIILFVMFRKKWKNVAVFWYVLISASVFLLAFIPFSPGGNLATFVAHRLTLSLQQYPYTSVNAFNAWGLFGFWRSETLIHRVVGLGAVLSFFFVALRKLKKRKFFIYILSAIIFLSTFLFFTRIHERHLLPMFAPLSVAAAANPILWLPFIGLSVTYVLNLYYSYNWIVYDFATVLSPAVISTLIIFNILFLLMMFRSSTVKSIIAKVKTFKFFNPLTLNVGINKKHARMFLLAIIAFSFFARIISLGSPDKEYFDEVYHAFTARRILNGDPKAWEWWNENPDGFAYEWTHPPLAKLGMVTGMKMFGESPVGWRVVGTLLGTGMVGLIYALTNALLKDRLAAIFAALFFALDGLALVMSRIAMNDIYFLFFAMLSLLLYLRGKNGFSALSFGLAIASKWSAVFLIPIIVVAHFAFKRKFKLSYLWFVILPPLIYLATYTPMFLTGHGLDIFWGTQKQMWWYHTGLDATHAYTSNWLTWPILARPVYLFTSDEIAGVVSRIYAMGNPFVFWGGLTSIGLTAIYSFVRKNRKLGLIVFSYLVFFAAWAGAPRIMFLYHYLPSLPFLVIAMGWVFARFWRMGGRSKVFATLYLLLITFSFLYFYPHWAGLEIPLSLDKSYYWFSSWR